MTTINTFDMEQSKASKAEAGRNNLTRNGGKMRKQLLLGQLWLLSEDGPGKLSLKIKVNRGNKEGGTILVYHWILAEEKQTS